MISGKFLEAYFYSIDKNKTHVIYYIIETIKRVLHILIHRDPSGSTTILKCESFSPEHG